MQSSRASRKLHRAAREEKGRPPPSAARIPCAVTRGLLLQRTVDARAVVADNLEKRVIFLSSGARCVLHMETPERRTSQDVRRSGLPIALTGRLPSHRRHDVRTPSAAARACRVLPIITITNVPPIGLARAASALRQSQPASPPSNTSSPLLSLPAHLRTSTAPRIPSPLGRGTPNRVAPGVSATNPATKTTPGTAPVKRTSKMSQKHVLLPEEPQTKPMPASAMNHPPASAPARSPSAWQSESLTTAVEEDRTDERTEAEKMSKSQREEAGLPRLTAYATADGYKTKLLQAFLKREHGVGVVRVFDDAVYAVRRDPFGRIVAKLFAGVHSAPSARLRRQYQSPLLTGRQEPRRRLPPRTHDRSRGSRLPRWLLPASTGRRRAADGSYAHE